MSSRRCARPLTRCAGSTRCVEPLCEHQDISQVLSYIFFGFVFLDKYILIFLRCAPPCRAATEHAPNMLQRTFFGPEGRTHILLANICCHFSTQFAPHGLVERQHIIVIQHDCHGVEPSAVRKERERMFGDAHRSRIEHPQGMDRPFDCAVREHRFGRREGRRCQERIDRREFSRHMRHDVKDAFDEAVEHDAWDDVTARHRRGAAMQFVLDRCLHASQFRPFRVLESRPCVGPEPRRFDYVRCAAPVKVGVHASHIRFLRDHLSLQRVDGALTRNEDAVSLQCLGVALRSHHDPDAAAAVET